MVKNPAASFGVSSKAKAFMGVVTPISILAFSHNDVIYILH